MSSILVGQHPAFGRNEEMLPLSLSSLERVARYESAIKVRYHDNVLAEHRPGCFVVLCKGDMFVW